MDLNTLKKSVCNGNNCTDGHFILIESDPNATLREVTMCDIPQNALIIKMDNKIKFNNFLKDQWGFNKHSDFLIVTDDKLVFIEIKSITEVNQKLEDECQKKFLSDECTVNYADIIFQKMLSKNTFFDKREPHYVLLFQSPSIAKTTTTVPTTASNTSPYTFRKVAVSNGSTISYHRMI